MLEWSDMSTTHCFSELAL